MKESFNRLEQNVVETLRQFEAEPSANMWERIESRLSKEQQKPFFLGFSQINNYKTLALSIAALLLFVAAGMGYYFYNHRSNKTELVKEKIVQPKLNNISEELSDNQSVQKETTIIVGNAEINQNEVNTTDKSSNSHSTTNESDARNAVKKIQEASATKNSNKLAKNKSKNIPGLFNINKNKRDKSNLSLNNVVPREKYESLETLELDVNKNGELLASEANVALLQKLEVEPVFDPSKKNIIGFYVGPDIGAGYSWFKANDGYQNEILGKEIDYQGQPSYASAVKLGYNFKRNITLEGGVGVEQQSQNYNSRNFERPVSGKMDFTYVETPLTVKYRVNTLVGKKFIPASINAVVGLQYAYLMRAGISVNIPSQSYPQTKYDGKPYFPNHDLGLILGFDYDFYLKNNLILNVGMNGKVAGDASQFPMWMSTKDDSFSHITIGIHCGVRFFKAAKVK